MKKFLAILLALVMTMSLCACNLSTIGSSVNSFIDDVVSDFEEELHAGLNPEVNPANAKISITMLDVGQGLSILIESNGEYMLYDGGDRGTSSYVVSYLKKHNVTELEYMIASHYDADHIAGLVGVLETTTVNNVINPAYKTDTKIYESYILGVQNSGAEVIYPSVGDTYELGEATFTVLAPVKQYNDPNEMSVAIKIDCGEFDCVITGDAEAESERAMLDSGLNLNTDLFVAGHHGSSSSNGDAFVQALKPEYAFISCGKDNDYGHPHQETLDTFAKYNVQVFRSDIDGEVTCYYDGIRYAFDKDVAAPSTNNNTTNDTTEPSDVVVGDVTYVLNTNSHKFHYADCASVADMNENNKEESTATRDELINNGYSPCGVCKP